MGLSYHIHKIATYQWASASQFVNKQDTACLSEQANNVVDSLILESIRFADANLSVYRSGIVLNRRNSSHLNRCLQSACNEETTERRSVGEELDV